MKFAKQIGSCVLAVALMLSLCVGAWTVSADTPTVDDAVKSIMPEFSAEAVATFDEMTSIADAGVWEEDYAAYGRIQDDGTPSMAYCAKTKGDGSRHDLAIPFSVSYGTSGIEQYLMFYLDTGDNTITKGWLGLKVGNSILSPDDYAADTDVFYYQDAEGKWQAKGYASDDNGCYENFKCKGYVMIPLSQFGTALVPGSSIDGLVLYNKNVDITTESYLLVDDVCMVECTEAAMLVDAFSVNDFDDVTDTPLACADSDVVVESGIGARNMYDVANGCPKSNGLYLKLDTKTADTYFSIDFTADPGDPLKTSADAVVDGSAVTLPATYLVFWVDTCGKSIHKGWLSAYFDGAWHTPDDELEEGGAAATLANNFLVYGENGWEVVDYFDNDKGCFKDFNFTGYVAVPLASFGFNGSSFPDITDLRINFKAPDWNGHDAASYEGMHLAVDNIATVFAPNIFAVPAAAVIKGEYPEIKKEESSSTPTESSSAPAESSSAPAESSSTPIESSSTPEESSTTGDVSVNSTQGGTSAGNVNTGMSGVAGAAGALVLAAAATMAAFCFRRKK